MNKKSRLHLPSPPARPGQKPDFSYVQLSPAGAVAAPRSQRRARATSRTSRRGAGARARRRAARRRSLESAPRARRSCRSACATCCSRAVRRPHAAHAAPGRQISFYIARLGEEAVSVAQCMALQPGDMLFPSYRNQGLHIVRGRSLVDLMCQCLSNTRDMCKGRQMPIMYHSGRGQHLLHLRQPRHAVSAGRGLGDGRGASRARIISPRAGSARARARRRTFTTP